MLIQLILSIPLAILIILFLIQIHKQTFFKVLFILIAAVGVILIFNPALTTAIANYFGVGRGADLLLYISIIFFFMFIIVLYGKIRSIEATQTIIIRQIAIDRAKRMNL
ncbi:MAG: DUF2304 domain-containing protein [Chitinophagales bacterium]|nr:DUF2304 domain-containing protein [Chitinophagales bacterium]MDW8273308.1 DUF2304 domain-containing protein [Chitinophagales bacterium]